LDSISFLESIDLIVMRGKTFEQVIAFNYWSYKDTKIIVLTTNHIEIPEKLNKTVATSNTASSAQLINEQSDQSINHIYRWEHCDTRFFIIRIG
jgi:dihydrofolate reductase